MLLPRVSSRPRQESEPVSQRSLSSQRGVVDLIGGECLGSDSARWLPLGALQKCFSSFAWAPAGQPAWHVL